MPGQTRTSLLLAAWPRLALGLFLAFLAPFYVLHIQSIASEWVFNDDERQWLWPMLRYVDSGLFHNDYLFDYAMAEAPVGYKTIYWLGSMIIDPRWLSKLLCYVLLLVTVLFGSLSAAQLAGAMAAWATAGLLLVGDFWLAAIAGGLPRSFSSAFSAVAMYSLVSNRPWLLAIMTPIAASIYPPVCLVMGTALAILFLLPTASGGPSEHWTLGRRVAVLVSSGIITLAILTSPLAEQARFGSLIDATDPADVAAYPERLARHPLEMPHHLVNWSSRKADWPGVLTMPLDITAEASNNKWHLISSNSGLGKLLVAAIFAASVFIVWRNADKGKATRLYILPVAAVGVSLLATALYPKLFYPARYLISVPLFFFTAFPAALALSRANSLNAKNRLAVGIITFLIIFGGRGPNPAVGFESAEQDQQLIFNYLKMLPKDALIAGWEADSVPLLSRRSVLFSGEMHNVHRTTYALEMRKRVDAFIDAYFAVGSEPLVRLHRDFGVWHLIADRRHFNLDDKRLYFAPFDGKIKAIKKATRDQTKIVEQLMDSPYAHSITPNVSIIDLARWVETDAVDE